MRSKRSVGAPLRGAEVGGGAGVHAEALVELLPVAAAAHGLHHHVLGREERDLGFEPAARDLGVHDQPAERRSRARTRIASVARKASGTAMRLLAESSSVRSSHCVAAVIAVSSESAMTWRASEQIRSARIGFRL